MANTVIFEIHSGCHVLQQKPEGIKVIVRDFDVQDQEPPAIYEYSEVEVAKEETEFPTMAFNLEVSTSEVQTAARQCIGRDLTSDEIRQLKKGFNDAAGIAFSDSWLRNAIVDIVET